MKKEFAELSRWLFRTYCTKQIGKKAYPLIKQKLALLFPQYFDENGNFREELQKEIDNNYKILGVEE